jgi:hypothetical protein
MSQFRNFFNIYTLSCSVNLISSYGSFMMRTDVRFVVKGRGPAGVYFFEQFCMGQGQVYFAGAQKKNKKKTYLYYIFCCFLSPPILTDSI